MAGTFRRQMDVGLVLWGRKKTKAPGSQGRTQRTEQGMGWIERDIMEGERGREYEHVGVCGWDGCHAW